ncbi:ABC transporter ATP-binding protein/permease [Mycoplasmatota bacterium zrk1]
MISIKEVTKIYRTKKVGAEKVLDNASFIFKGRSKIAIVGQSGSGKTTLLNLIGGLDSDFVGELLFDNEKIEDFDKYRRENISFVFQDYNLINHLSLVKNITIGLTNDISNKEEKALDLLNSVGLLDHAYKFPNQLSGGEKQRVAIARALGRDTEVLLCDEPTGNLDENFTTEIMELIIKNSTNKTVILITHDEDLANKYCDEIIHIKAGKLYSKKLNTKSINIEAPNKSDNETSFKGRFFINLLSRKRSLISFSILIILMSAIFLLGLGIVSGIKDEVDQHILREHKVDRLVFNIYYSHWREINLSVTGFDYIVDQEKLNSGDMIMDYMVKSNLGTSIETQEGPVFIDNNINSLPSGVRNSVEENIVYGRFPENKYELLYSKGNALNLIFYYNCGNTNDINKIENCINKIKELSDKEIYDTITLLDITYFTREEKPLVVPFGYTPSENRINLENDYKIVGILNDYNYGENSSISFEHFTPLVKITTNDNIYTLEEDFIEYLDNTGFTKYRNIKFSEYAVFIKEENLDIRREIFASILDNNVIVAGVDYPSQEREELQNLFYGYRVGIFSASLLLAGFGGIVIYNGIKSSVIRNRKNVGVYRSLGYTSKNVRRMFMKEGLIISFTIAIVSIIVWFILKLIINPAAVQVLDPNGNLGFTNLLRLNTVAVVGIILIILYFVLSPINKILKETDIIKVIR